MVHGFEWLYRVSVFVTTVFADADLASTTDVAGMPGSCQGVAKAPLLLPLRFARGQYFPASETPLPLLHRDQVHSDVGSTVSITPGIDKGGSPSGLAIRHKEIYRHLVQPAWAEGRGSPGVPGRSSSRFLPFPLCLTELVGKTHTKQVVEEESPA